MDALSEGNELDELWMIDDDSHRCIWGDVQPSSDDFGGGYPYVVCEICGAIKSMAEPD